MGGRIRFVTAAALLACLALPLQGQMPVFDFKAWYDRAKQAIDEASRWTETKAQYDKAKGHFDDVAAQYDKVNRLVESLKGYETQLESIERTAISRTRAETRAAAADALRWYRKARDAGDANAEAAKSLDAAREALAQREKEIAADTQGFTDTDAQRALLRETQVDALRVEKATEEHMEAVAAASEDYKALAKAAYADWADDESELQAQQRTAAVLGAIGKQMESMVHSMQVQTSYTQSMHRLMVAQVERERLAVAQAQAAERGQAAGNDPASRLVILPRVDRAAVLAPDDADER